MARVYLETSFISACVSTRTDTASAYRQELSLEWMRSFADLHRLFVSAEMTNELDVPAFPNRTHALAMIDDFAMLTLTEDVAGLAAIFVREQVMPGPVRGDAIHVAVCCVHSIDFLLSWNVRHLANPRKIVHLKKVCVRAGYVPPQIVTPDLLWDDAP